MKFIFFIVIIAITFFPTEARADFDASYKQNEIINQLKSQINFLELEIQRLISLINQQNKINAGSYLVLDLSDSSVLYEKNSSIALPIASITKLMNAIVVKENTGLEQTTFLTLEMLKPQGYSPCLFLGLKISVENLLKASLTQSVNDAAESLASFIGKEKFLEAMNKKAKQLEMFDTLFTDPTGLDTKNISTASDLSKLLKYIHTNHPDLLSISKNNNFWLSGIDGKMLKFKNMNIFYNHPQFIGGKTGYLIESKQTLASIFNIKEKPVAIIILHSPNSQSDVLEILNWLK